MEFPSPLRLATGSHQAGSGKGCAMNIISWENGDTIITDDPSCAHPVLSHLVKAANDSLCNHWNGSFDDTSLLCPECSVKVLTLAHRTVGTADMTTQQLAAWIAEAIDSPEWGTRRFADPPSQYVSRVAELYRRAASGSWPQRAEWLPEHRERHGLEIIASRFAVAGAHIAVMGHSGELRYALTYACNAYIKRAPYVPDARLHYLHLAIDAWERIAGKTAPEPVAASVCDAYARMTATAATAQ